MKTVYQTDFDGFFTGPVEADPSPLEPGVWLIPAGAVEVEPPELGSGQRARWNGGAWDVIDPPPPPPAPPPPTPEEVLASERAAMRCSRFQALAALHLSGHLKAVETAVAQADPLAQLAWANAGEFRRDSPTIAALAGAVGMTEDQIDDLFRVAMRVEA